MSLEVFFNPRSVAIVGASQHKGKVGYEILANIMKGGFAGRIYPINNKAQELSGLPCYPDLMSIGQVPDLVLIIVPATSVPEVLHQCAQIKAKSVVIVTAGFKEVGAQGLKLEEQIVQIAHQNGIRFLGPNCLGVISTAGKLNASFGGDMPVSGVIGYLSQSGALLATILDMANANDIGFSTLVSIGNKADID